MIVCNWILSLSAGSLGRAGPSSHRLRDVLGGPDLSELDIAGILAQCFSKVSRQG